MPDIIAIGGGQASFSFINKLRLLGYKKSISLICGENILPIKATPIKEISYGYLNRNVYYLSLKVIRENNIEVIKGLKVQKLTEKKSFWIMDKH